MALFGPDGRPPTTMNDPYQSRAMNFLDQTQGAAEGTAPSLADAEFRRRQQEMLQQQLAMGRGRSAGAARQSSYAGAQMSQGLNQGAAQAQLAEQMANKQLYAQQLNQGSQNDFQRQNADMQRWLALKAMPTDMDKLMQAGLGAGAIAAKL